MNFNFNKLFARKNVVCVLGPYWGDSAKGKKPYFFVDVKFCGDYGRWKRTRFSHESNDLNIKHVARTKANTYANMMREKIK
ncbi:MAG: hypothetical protein FWG80_03935 [Alphaproteobacteria bacterium]|nr:hypothetical protein [Alphaproteobacteria bacterium]